MSYPNYNTFDDALAALKTNLTLHGWTEHASDQTWHKTIAYSDYSPYIADRPLNDILAGKCCAVWSPNATGIAEFIRENIITQDVEEQIEDWLNFDELNFEAYFDELSSWVWLHIEPDINLSTVESYIAAIRKD